MQDLILSVKKLKKKTSSITVSGKTLTNNELKDITNVIRPLEDRDILLKETTKKKISQK